MGINFWGTCTKFCGGTDSVHVQLYRYYMALGRGENLSRLVEAFLGERMSFGGILCFSPFSGRPARNLANCGRMYCKGRSGIWWIFLLFSLFFLLFSFFIFPLSYFLSIYFLRSTPPNLAWAITSIQWPLDKLMVKEVHRGWRH